MSNQVRIIAVLLSAVIIHSQIQFVHAESLPAFSDLAANVDPHSGSANFSIPIDVPSGRQGIRPNVQIQYNSGIRNGIFGVGWTLELGSIQAWTSRGIPKYDSTDYYCLMQAGVSESLTYDTTAGFYRTKIEGSFMKTRRIGDYWLTTDKQGTKYFFGETAASREHDPGNPSKISKWYLNRVEDIHGNFMTISYTRDQNKLYPQYIDYTGHVSSGIAPHARVEFELEDRADKALSFITGYRMETAKRIKNIKVLAGGILQRRYQLNYATSAMTKRSLLSSVALVGSDNTSSLPSLTFEYQDETPASFVSTNNLILPSHLGFTEGGSGDNGVRLADVNGDGLMDIMWADDNAGEYQTWLNSGTGFTQTNNWVIPVVQDGGLSHFSVQLADVSGDGLVDLVYSKGTSMTYHKTYINSGTGFVQTSNWVLPTDLGFTEQTASGDNGVRFADLNGDGLTDVIWADGSSSSQRKVFLNNGTTFVQSSNWVVPSHLGFNESDWNDNGVRFADVNGDGLSDMVWAEGTGTSNYQTWLNNGSAFEQTSNWIIPAVQAGGLTSPNLSLSDMNGDGLVDVVWADDTNMSQHKTFLNDGTNFVEDTDWNVPSNLGFSEVGSNDDNGVRLADINGDGMTDILQGDGTGMDQHLTYLNSKFMPDLLVQINNGIGGSTVMAYAPSTKYTNTFLPFVTPVITSITNQNVQGDAYTSTYAYANGLWLGGLKRNFRGFGFVKVTDIDGNYAETDFLQDDIFKGRPSEQRTFNSAGQLFQKTTNTWNNLSLGSYINFPFLKRKDNFIYDGNATGRRTAEESFYEESPQYGNLTKAIQWGEVDLTTGADIGTDSRRIETSYVNNATDWIIGLPKYSSSYNHQGQQMRKTWFYYDGQINAAAPLKGLLTKRELWNNNAEGHVNNPKTEYTYDTQGNLLTTKDPLGRMTSIVYDATHKIFPLTTRNALTHQVVNKYYGINGELHDDGAGLKGLWGQLKSTTDPNNKEGKRTYDTFGRLIASISPLDTVAKPTSTIEYELTPSYTKIKTSQRVNHGQDQMISSAQFADGLGRILQTKSASGSSGQFIVRDQKTYTLRGLPEKQFFPRFTSNDLDTMDPLDLNGPYSRIVYDAMGRAVQTTNPDGSYASIAYDDWTLRSINENGHKQESTFDAYGRLIEKREYTGADGRAAVFYPLTSYALYAATQYTYDTEGNLVQTKDAQNNLVTISYDYLGRKIAMSDPDMGNWTYQYDLNGNLTKQTDAKGQAIDFTYDSINRLTKKNQPTTLNVDYTYDTVTVSNSIGRLVGALYGTNNNASFEYDAIGREKKSTKIIDGQSFTVERSYDALNNLIQIKYPDAKNIYYDYNDAGQIKAIADDPGLFDQQSSLQNRATLFSGLSDLFEQYVLGVRPAYAQTVPAAPSGLSANVNSSSSINLAWTDNSSTELGFKIERGVGSAPTTWSQIGIVAANLTTFSSTGLTIGTTYSYRIRTYNATGNSLYSNTATATIAATIPAVPTNLSAVGVSATQINLAWTDNSSNETGFKIYRGVGSAPASWSEIATVTANTKSFSNNSGLTSGTTYTYRVWSYNSIGNSVSSSNAATAIAQSPGNLYIKKVEYNVSGQITRIEYGNNVVTTQEYDPLTMRLKRILTVNGGGTKLQDLNYTYDPAGNIVGIDDFVHTATQDFAYDSLNRLKQAIGAYGTKNYTYDEIGNILTKDGKTYSYGAGAAGPHAVTALNDGTTFTYDLNGNMVTRQKGTEFTEYFHDMENRLKEVKKNGASQASFAYDGDGGRIKKIGNDGVTKYVGSIYEVRGSVANSYIYLGDIRVASIAGGEVKYFHSDHLGGANVLTNNLGVKKELTEYDPFGSLARHEMYGSSTEIARFYFTGKELDEEIGLHYFGGRYYDQTIGRFITADIILQDLENPQAFNRYSYTSNNPINSIDPDGHSWLKKIFRGASNFFNGIVSWLEKVTNSNWNVNVEVGQTHEFQDASTLTKSTAHVGITAVTQPWQFVVGVSTWIHEPRFQILENPSVGQYVTSGIGDYDNVFINGILNKVPYAFQNAEKANGLNYKSLKVAYNPTDGAVADLTESVLQKLFLTSSFDRQLANELVGHKGIVLSGHSQGAIIASNVLLNLGLRNQRNVVSDAIFLNTQISGPRAYLAAASAGVNAKHVTYGSRYFDFSNALGPNVSEPLKLMSGLAGLTYLPLGMAHHGLK